MQKKFFINIFLVFCIILIGACSKKEKLSKEDMMWTYKEIPHHIDKKIKDNIMIDAKVTILPGFENGKADIYKIKNKMIDRKLVREILIKNKAIVNTKTEKYGKKEELTVDYHKLDNGDILSIGDEWFNYQSELLNYMSYCIRFSTGQEDNNVEEFEKNIEDFKYISLKDAEQKCVEIAENLELSIDEESYRSYRLSHETLKQEENVIMNPGLEEEYQPHPKPEWTTEDDSYYFEFLPTINGYGFVPDCYAGETERVRGVNKCYMTYNRNGIVGMSNSDVFEIESIIEEQVNLLNLDTALKEVEKNYEQVIVRGSINITEIYLGNVVLFQEQEGIYMTIPVWAFSIEEKKENESPRYFKKLIDATTGKEIY